MKKIIYIANLRLPTEKAYGIQISEMCRALAGLGIDVTLIFPYRKNPHDDIFGYYGIERNFKVRMLPALDFYFPGRLDRISVLTKNFISAVILAFYALTSKTEIIYSRDELPIFLLSFFRNNLFFEAHKFSEHRKIFYYRFKKRKIRIIAISNAIKEKFLKLGFGSSDILVAPDGVNLPQFDISIDKQSAREKLSLPLDKKIVLYSGHLFEWKGAQTLLEVARMSNVIFVFVGGTEYDVEKFKQKAKDLNNVIILGHKPHKEIPLFLKAADVLVLPNSASDKISSYTSPLKLFEYMASGRPIVASDLPSIREILNEKNSILVRPDDPNSLAEGIKRIFDTNIFGDEISKKAREDVENYSWQKRAQKIINFIK